jgi:hypothetical protein
MSQVPPLNHWWHVPLYVSARGLTTSAMPFDDRAFEIAFDFVDHRLTAVDSRGRSFAFDLEPMSVAAFYRTLMAGLARIDIVVPIHPVPNEVKVAIPFAEDEEHASYDRGHVAAFFEGSLPRTVSSPSSGDASWARPARSSSSGAASTSRPIASRALRLPSIRAASRTAPTGS